MQPQVLPYFGVEGGCEYIFFAEEYGSATVHTEHLHHFSHGGDFGCANETHVLWRCAIQGDLRYKTFGLRAVRIAFHGGVEEGECGGWVFAGDGGAEQYGAGAGAK